MTFVANWKKCSRCHKMYSLNPDVGVYSCPWCGKGKNILSVIKKRTGMYPGIIHEEKLRH